MHRIQNVLKAVKRISLRMIQLPSIHWKIVVPISLSFLVMIAVNFNFSRTALQEASDASMTLLEQQQAEKQAYVHESYASIVTSTFKNYELRLKDMTRSSTLFDAMLSGDQAAVQKFVNDNASKDELIWITRIEKDVNNDGIIDEEEKKITNDPYREPPLPVYASTEAETIGQEPWYIENDRFANPTAPRFVIEDTPFGSMLYSRYNISDREYGKMGEITYGVLLNQSFLQDFVRVTKTPTTLVMLEGRGEEAKLYVAADSGGDLLGDDFSEISYENLGQKVYLDDLGDEYGEVKRLLPYLEQFTDNIGDFTEIVEMYDEAYSVLFKPVFGKRAQAEGILISRFPGFVASKAEMLDQAQATQQFSLITSLIIIAIGIAICMVVARSISTPIRRIQAVMNEIGKGNLTVHVEPRGRDELSDLALSINHTTEQLRSLIRKVYTSSHEVVHVSGQLVSSMEQNAVASNSIAENTSEVNQNTYRLNESATQATEITEHMNQGIRDIAERSGLMEKAADKTVHTVKDGNEKVAALRNQIERIQADVSQTSASLSHLNQASVQISEMTDMIQEIASQTNLLALNASIEAAHAGEHGRGFAVVADEVKKLSVEAQNTTVEMTNLIHDIQQRTKETVDSMNVSQNEITQGIEHTNDVSQSFHMIQQELDQLYQNIENVTRSIEEIEAGSERFVGIIYEVQQNSSETNENIERIAATTEEISASADETQSLTRSFNQIASDLQNEIKVFKTEEDS